jgi:hypothetical protein
VAEGPPRALEFGGLALGGTRAAMGRDSSRAFGSLDYKDSRPPRASGCFCDWRECTCGQAAPLSASRFLGLPERFTWNNLDAVAKPDPPLRDALSSLESSCPFIVSGYGGDEESPRAGRVVYTGDRVSLARQDLGASQRA